MDKVLETGLIDVLATYKQRKARLAQEKNEREYKEAEFLSQFYVHCKKVIEPAFEEFKKIVKELGDIECRIEKHPPTDSITIAFLISDVGPGQASLSEYPHLTISCDKHNCILSVHKYNRIEDGPAETGLGLEEVNEEYLHSRLLELLNEELS